MNGELDIAGIFVPSAFVCALAAVVLIAVLRRIFEATGFYRLVWHRALFDLALFFALWGVLTALSFKS
ncbi:MAG: DUF1656 domain-containing protein [Myxococcaceae bacterium]